MNIEDKFYKYCQSVKGCENCQFHYSGSMIDCAIRWSRAEALKDAEKRYREWIKSEYGKEVDDDNLTIRVLRNIIDELNEKVERLEHEKRALANRCYVLTRGLMCNHCAVDGCRYKAKEQKND